VNKARETAAGIVRAAARNSLNLIERRRALASTSGSPFTTRGDFCLTGKSPVGCPAPLAKIFAFSFGANHLHVSAIPSHTEGRFAIVTDVGTGCDGRGSIRRATVIDDHRRPWANDADADDEVVWS